MTKSKGIGRGGARKGAGRKSKKAVHIKVWKWESAPEELKALSHHGGDEDWVALVPSVWANQYISWLGSHKLTAPLAMASLTLVKSQLEAIKRLLGYVAKRAVTL